MEEKKQESAITFPLKFSCLKCAKKTLNIQENMIPCSTCQYTMQYACPLCNAPTERDHIQTLNNQTTLNCQTCKKKTPLKKIQYLINEQMRVDHDTKCQYCNSPTIHRQKANLSHRCFFYPNCSGQSDLFNDKKTGMVFLDFETTGLEIGKNSIIEIGAIKIDEEGYEHTYQTLVKPRERILPHITKITSITQDMVEDAPCLEDTLKQLITFIGNRKIVAHNTDFDIPWLITSAKKLNLTLENNELTCTLKWAKNNKEARCSLGALTKKYHIGHDNAHRALADSCATKELFFIFENQNITSAPEMKLDNYLEQSEKITEKYKEIIQV